MKNTKNIKRYFEPSLNQPKIANNDRTGTYTFLLQLKKTIKKRGWFVFQKGKDDLRKKELQQNTLSNNSQTNWQL